MTPFSSSETVEYLTIREKSEELESRAETALERNEVEENSHSHIRFSLSDAYVIMSRARYNV